MAAGGCRVSVAPQSPVKAEVQKVFQNMFSSFRERSGMRRMRV